MTSLITIFSFICISNLLIISVVLPLVSAGLTKPRLRITSDLDDVEDDEEDEDWKEWGKVKPPEVKDGKIDLSAVKDYTTARLSGPAFGFLMLRHRRGRGKDDVKHFAHKWTNLMMLSPVKARFYPMDHRTMYVRIVDERQLDEVVDFILGQEEAYEFMVNKKHYLRKGDPPLTQVSGEPDIWKHVEEVNADLLERYLKSKARSEAEL